MQGRVRGARRQACPAGRSARSPAQGVLAWHVSKVGLHAWPCCEAAPEAPVVKHARREEAPAVLSMVWHVVYVKKTIR